MNTSWFHCLPYKLYLVWFWINQRSQPLWYIYFKLLTDSWQLGHNCFTCITTRDETQSGCALWIKNESTEWKDHLVERNTKETANREVLLKSFHLNVGTLGLVHRQSSLSLSRSENINVLQKKGKRSRAFKISKYFPNTHK